MITTDPWTDKEPFSVMRDEHGFPWAIACKGQAVLHVNGDTVITGTYLPAIMTVLNSLRSKQCAMILSAAKKGQNEAHG